MFGLLKKNYEAVTAEAVKDLKKDKDTVVIDVRQPYEFKAGHMIGAKLIPLGEIGSRMNEIPKDKKVILVCASGARSGRAAGVLSKSGYEVYNMVGGMSRWTGKVKR